MREDTRANDRTLIFPIRRSLAEGETRPMNASLIAFPTGARLGADRTVIARRPSGSAVAKEPIAMHASHLGLHHVHAESRRRDMLAEAEQERRLNLLSRTNAHRPAAHRAVAALRRRVGSALVRAGERVQGAAPAADHLPRLSTLRTAR